MKFTKMHGLGNDYLYVYGEASLNIKKFTPKLSECHFETGYSSVTLVCGTGAFELVIVAILEDYC